MMFRNDILCIGLFLVLSVYSFGQTEGAKITLANNASLQIKDSLSSMGLFPQSEFYCDRLKTNSGGFITQDWDPRCGSDYETYQNESACQISGIKKWKKGECGQEEGEWIYAICDDEGNRINDDCSCGPPEEYNCDTNPHPDYDALMALYDSTNGAKWKNNVGWKEGKEGTSCDPCEDRWNGIDCRGERVFDIDLSENGLSGKIPDQIANLNELFSLNFRDNNLGGTLPSNLGNLNKLKYFSVGANNMSGMLPDEIGNLTSLQYLDLADNNFSGSLPATLANLIDLQELYLNENNLEGSLPNNLGNLNKLKTLNIRGNDMSGMLPDEIGNLISLRHLILSNNDFTGPIPKSLANLANLFSLRCSKNNFAGCIPSSLEVFLDNIGFDPDTTYVYQGYNFMENPKLPHQGDLSKIDSFDKQIGSPCDADKSEDTKDEILDDCICGLPCEAVETEFEKTLCWNETLEVGNELFSNDRRMGEVTLSKKNDGCDSIVTIKLQFTPLDTIVDIIVTCKEYKWRDNIAYNSSNYEATYLAESNDNTCDTVYQLNLSIVEEPEAVIYRDTLCWNKTKKIGNTIFSNANSSRKVTFTKPFCDSIVMVDLHFTPLDTIIEQIEACESYPWRNGQIYTANQSGVMHTAKSENACDTVYRLDLKISDAITTDLDTLICPGETFTFQDTSTTEETSLVFPYKSVNGCDSTVIIHVIHRNRTEVQCVEGITIEKKSEEMIATPESPITFPAIDDRTESITIFGRWSNRVYYQKQPGADFEWWGQTTSGDTLPEGTYYYLIKPGASDDPQSRPKGLIKGYITFLR